jgi:anti-anti-sigma factor
VIVEGEVDISNAPQLRLTLSRVIAAGEGDVAVDVGAVTFIDSSGLAELIRAHLALQALSRRLVLQRVNGRVRRVLDVAGVAFLAEGGPAGPLHETPANAPDGARRVSGAAG